MNILFLIFFLFSSNAFAQNFGNLYNDKAKNVKTTTATFGRFIPVSASTVQSALDYLNQNGASSQWTTSGNNIYNSNSDNVGINSSNPGARLDVQGNIRAVNSTTELSMYTNGSNGMGTDAGITFKMFPLNFSMGTILIDMLGVGVSHSFSIFDKNDAGAEMLTVDGKGNVIVGNPDNPNKMPSFSIYDNSGQIQHRLRTDGVLSYLIGQGGILVVGSSSNNGSGDTFQVSGKSSLNGNVGIGMTSSSQAPLTVRTGTDQNLVVQQPIILGDGVAISSVNDAVSVNKGFELRGSTVQMTTVGTNPILFYINQNEKMRVDGSGNVGIQQSAPVNFLDINTQNSSGVVIGAANDGYSGVASAPLDGILVEGAVNAASFSGDGSALTNLPSTSQWNTVSGGIDYTAGKVGIGGAATYADLEIIHAGGASVMNDSNATMEFSSGGNATNVWFNTKTAAAGGTDANWLFRINGSNSAPWQGLTFNVPNNFLAIGPDAGLGGGVINRGLVVNSSGNIGIGTITPVSRLTVVGSVGIGTTGTAYVTTVPPTNGLTVQGNIGIATWQANNSLIVASGNVGIGSLAPGKLLDVFGTTRFLGGGNVSIGSVAPGQALDVVGTIRASSDIKISSQSVCQANGTNCLSQSTNAVSFVSYQPGLLTAVNSTIGVNFKFSKASTVDNIIGSAVTFSCVANPTVTLYECGTSTTCTTPTTIGTVTVTAAGTAVTGTVSSSAITAGDYIGWAITAGTCASIDIAATAQVHSN